MSSQTHRGFKRLLKILLGSTLLAVVDIASAVFTLTEVVTPSLGTFFSGASGRQFILNTDETVSGTDAGDFLFGAVSGQLTLIGENANVNIVAENITTAGGVTVNAIPCRFHIGAQTTCDGAGINEQIKKNAARTLYVGVDLTTSQVHNGGDTASATFDITVTIL